MKLNKNLTMYKNNPLLSCKLWLWLGIEAKQH